MAGERRESVSTGDAGGCRGRRAHRRHGGRRGGRRAASGPYPDGSSRAATGARRDRDAGEQALRRGDRPSGSRPNLARQLFDSGHTFAGYSEDLPSTGWRGCAHRNYVRRHNPWVDFSNVPASANRPLTTFPEDYRKLPTVSFVTPNLCHDMHDCPKDQADAWLKKRFAPYVAWAKTHHSLFILTFDEDDQTDHNHIPTIVAGAGVKPGSYGAHLHHYDLLRTLQRMYGLPLAGNAARVKGLPPVWTGA